jgi:hypothetical protein
MVEFVALLSGEALCIKERRLNSTVLPLFKIYRKNPPVLHDEIAALPTFLLHLTTVRDPRVEIRRQQLKHQH